LTLPAANLAYKFPPAREKCGSVVVVDRNRGNEECFGRDGATENLRKKTTGITAHSRLAGQ
jgi:hypothetical protein